jgi:hypothetical protein
MNTSKTSTSISNAKQETRAYAVAINSLKHLFPQWDFSTRNNDIRMAQYFKFTEAHQLVSFKHEFGKMMRTNSVFVLIQKVPGKKSLLISVRLRPTESSIIAATEIAEFIEQNAPQNQSDTPKNVTEA